jgi:hypothetical protein
VADEAAAKGEHRLVHFGAAFVADEEPFELVEVGEGAFDNPADRAEPGDVGGLAACDHACDPSRSEQVAVFVVVVAGVGAQLVGTATGRPGRPATGGTRSSSGISWVTSLRLPPVRV